MAAVPDSAGVVASVRKPKEPLPPLLLGVKAARWRGYDPEAVAAEAKAEFERVRPSVLRRDRFRCAYCGFRSTPPGGKTDGDGKGSWMEVHHIDHDHGNNDSANLVTICNYCHMVFHIGLAGRHGARLVWLPELSQAAVSSVWRAFGALWWERRFVAERRLNPPTSSHRNEQFGRLFAVATESLSALMDERAWMVEKTFGTSDPSLLGDWLLRLAMVAPEVYEDRGRWLSGVRLLPPGPASGFAQSVERGAAMFWHWRQPEQAFGYSRPMAWAMMLERDANPLALLAGLRMVGGMAG